MAYTPWMTSQQIIESVKRKIMFPTSQQTFTDDDILAFANEEMAISQVPSVLEFHEEYFVFVDEIPLVQGTNRYAIPERALGMKLRDVKYKDINGNLFDMARIAPEDKAFYQRNIGTSETLSKYYIEGNDVVLLPALVVTDAVSLMFYYFLRPNQLVQNSRACIIQSFNNNITVINANVAPNDTVKISGATLTATNGLSVASSVPGYPTVVSTSAPHGLVSGQNVTISGNTTGSPLLNGTFKVTVTGPSSFSIPLSTSLAASDGVVVATSSQFLIGANDIETASNLVTAINASGLASATNNATSLVTLSFSNLAASQSLTVSNPDGFVTDLSVQTIQFDQVPATYTDPVNYTVSPLFVPGAQVDFLQTRPGHRTYAIDVRIPNSGISGTSISFLKKDVPSNITVGDYICLANECIIPQIPPDLHTTLAQRTAVMILSAIGDQAGTQAAAAKVQEMEKNQISLLDNRVESSPLKIAPKKSLLRFQGMGSRRRRL